MAGIDVQNSIVIQAPIERVFNTVLDYQHMHEWAKGYRCTLLNTQTVQEGSRIEHRPNKGVKFIRVIDKITTHARIEERYAEGVLIGTGVWTFEPNDGGTLTTFDCKVRANSFILKLLFPFVGAIGHRKAYDAYLQGLKILCEKPLASTA